MIQNQIILLGGGGHCKAVIDIIESSGQYHIAGVLDTPEQTGKDIMGYSIMGTDDDILHWKNMGCHFLVTVGSIKSTALREKLYNKVKEAGGILPAVISPTALVSKHASIGEGALIGHHAIVHAGATVAENCIINTAALIEHESVVGAHSHVATRAVINGQCVLGKHVFVGSNSVLINNIAIADKVVIGAGSVVVKHIAEQGIYAGNPIKFLGHND